MNDILNWFLMTPRQVLQKFAELPNSQYVFSNNALTSYCYVPGTRADRAVLVAHVDTVFESRRSKITPAIYKKEKIWCSYFEKGKEPEVGIGADDRAGCMALWLLRKMGHSLLLVDGEESGCIGSSAIANGTTPNRKALMDELNNHSFMIQFDRRGKDDLVFYSISTPEFEKYCEKSCPGFTKAHGSVTDISKLCRDVCGVNISSGYYNEHTKFEHWCYKEWLNTVRTVRKWIKGPLEKWKLVKPVYTYTKGHGYLFDDGDDYGYYGRGFGYGYGVEKHIRDGNVKQDRPPKNWFLKNESISVHQSLNPFETCPDCRGVFTDTEIHSNNMQCPDCGHLFVLKTT